MSVSPEPWPECRASPVSHPLQNLYGKSTTTDVLLKSDLQAKVLRNRLTPNLQDFVASSLEEIEYSAEKELPASQGTLGNSAFSLCAVLIPHQS